MFIFQTPKELISSAPNAASVPAPAVTQKGTRLVRNGNQLVEVIENNFDTDGMVFEFIPRFTAGA